MGLAPPAAQMSVQLGRPTHHTCARVRGDHTMNLASRTAEYARLLRALGGAMLVRTMAVAAASCAPKRPPSAALEPQDPAAPPEEQNARIAQLWNARTDHGVPADFCLGVGDLLEINVFHWDEMRGIRTRVSTTGMIN